jgi:HSP20 family protein
MTVTKFKPTRRSFLSDTFFPATFDSIFNDLMIESNNPINTFHTPAADVVEDDKQFKISLVFAGFEKEDIKLDMNEDELTVTGEKSMVKEEKAEKFLVKEFRTGKYKRSFYLPDTADVNKIEAELRNGILEIKIPKKAKAEAKKISIK